MSVKIAILNCYSDEPESAPSANYFCDYIDNSTIINICHNQKIDDLSEFDGYIISGSRSCHKDKTDWTDYLIKIIKNIKNEDIPCLAVCFGHQLAALTFGGKTVVKLGEEEGFQEVPTKYGDDDIELFRGLPNPVKIYQSHYDAVLKPPPNSINTIYNDKCVQYYQYGSIYSIQSHPEISVSTAIKIAKRDNQDIDEILNGVNEKNIQTQIVLKNFQELVEQSIK